MLEKPNIANKLIISRLEAEYDLRVIELTFLPLGADENTAVYRVLTGNGTVYFLKLRKNFDEIIVRVPVFLKQQGIQAIIVPFETRSKQYYADFGEYKLILYPFIEGKDGFERKLSDQHRQRLGAALKGIHSVPLPSALKSLIPRENYSPQWRELLKAHQARVENIIFDEPTAAKLANFMKSRQDEISYLIKRTAELASALQTRSLELVLCHSDFHGGNILISDDDELYIVDWDNPILAPKERDLMFIGGGIDEIWKSKRDESVFYEGYGKKEIDLFALAYYRYERIIEDLAVICEQLLSTDEGGADRERSYGWFTSNFEQGSTIEIARKTDKLLMNSL
ncbi:MAG TPA: aminoglycoside phosphotransferase family protein [Anaerolineales bacterium]|nr:aminoglycoside phosphotransferase family protein [Anaerolineales bacterium]